MKTEFIQIRTTFGPLMSNTLAVGQGGCEAIARCAGGYLVNTKSGANWFVPDSNVLFASLKVDDGDPEGRKRIGRPPGSKNKQ